MNKYFLLDYHVKDSDRSEIILTINAPIYNVNTTTGVIPKY